MPWPISLYQGPLSFAMSTPAMLPEFEFSLMRSGFVAARNERDALVFQCFECGNDILRSLNAGRIALRADQDEVVVHYRVTLDAESFRHEFLLREPRVDEHDVGVATAAGIDRLAGALRDDPHVNSRLRLKQRQEVAEQTGVLRRSG